MVVSVVAVDDDANESGGRGRHGVPVDNGRGREVSGQLCKRSNSLNKKKYSLASHACRYTR